MERIDVPRKALLETTCILAMALVAGSCGGNSPTGPSQPPPSSGVLSLTGDLNFGDVPVATLVQRTFTAANTGDASLSISASVPPGFVSTLTTDSLFPGETQTYHVIFTPSEARGYSGNLTISTSGTRTLPITGTGTLAPGLTAKVFSGDISGGDPKCVYGRPPFTFESGACKIFTLDVAARGPVHGLLNYNGDDALLELELFDPGAGDDIASGDLTFDPFPGDGEHSAFSANVSPGHYHVRVRAISSTKIAPFTVIVTHP
jgi:hypothetical protein